MSVMQSLEYKLKKVGKALTQSIKVWLPIFLPPVNKYPAHAAGHIFLQWIYQTYDSQWLSSGRSCWCIHYEMPPPFEGLVWYHIYLA